MTFKAPFPYFGGKSKVAADVWFRLGTDIKHYIEPFGGSLAVLLSRPTKHINLDNKLETVGDLNGFIANFWRALQQQPDKLASLTEGPLIEVDMHAQRQHLVNREKTLTEQLIDDPFYCDTQLAAWWVRGLCAWIGKGYPYVESRQRPQLHSGDGVFSLTRRSNLPEFFANLSERLKNVRICCSDWKSLITDYVLKGKNGLHNTAVFLDPPYTDKAGRDDGLYGDHDSLNVGHEVCQWAINNGTDPTVRIALCGYEGEYDQLHEEHDWSMCSWQTHGGYENQSSETNTNSTRERIWFSPHCLKPPKEIKSELSWDELTSL